MSEQKEREEKMNTKENDFKEQIKALKLKIALIRNDLQYADHGAYGQDVDRIMKYANELKRLQLLLEKSDE